MACNDYPLWFENAHAAARFTEFFSRFGFFYKTCGNKKKG